VHVYSDHQEQAIEEAFNTYLKAKITEMDNRIPLATVYTQKFFYLIIINITSDNQVYTKQIDKFVHKLVLIQTWVIQ
jgi:hypothetical protein